MILTKSITIVRKVNESVTLSLRLVFGILAYDDLFDKERKININTNCILISDQIIDKVRSLLFECKRLQWCRQSPTCCVISHSPGSQCVANNRSAIIQNLSYLFPLFTVMMDCVLEELALSKLPHCCLFARKPETERVHKFNFP